MQCERCLVGQKDVRTHYNMHNYFCKVENRVCWEWTLLERLFLSGQNEVLMHSRMQLHQNKNIRDSLRCWSKVAACISNKFGFVCSCLTVIRATTRHSWATSLWQVDADFENWRGKNHQFAESVDWASCESSFLPASLTSSSKCNYLVATHLLLALAPLFPALLVHAPLVRAPFPGKRRTHLLYKPTPFKC